MFGSNIDAMNYHKLNCYTAKDQKIDVKPAKAKDNQARQDVVVSLVRLIDYSSSGYRSP